MFKKGFFIVIISMITTAIAAQEGLSGRWGGVFNSPFGKNNRSFYFFIEMKQQDRAIWGVYNTNDSNSNVTFNCLCSFTGILPRQSSGYVDFFPENVVDHNPRKVTLPICENVRQISLHYFTDKEDQFLVGKWFLTSGDGPAPDGSAGTVVLQKLGNRITRDLQDYFPRLDRVIARGKDTTKTSFITPEVFTKSKNWESDLITRLKMFLTQK